jgi:signal transduction histidine kinase
MIVSSMAATVEACRRRVIGRSVELRSTPGWNSISTLPAMTAGPGRAYALEVTPLEQVRARRNRMPDTMLPLGWAVLAIVGLAGARSHPGPGLTGGHLGILLALVAFAAGVAGVMLLPRRSLPAQVASFGVLILSSAVLVALQPSGPGFLGAFIAVAAAAIRVRETPGKVLAGLALVALPLAQILGRDRSVFRALLQALGVVAFFVVARLAGRLAEGQEQAERLLQELEETREAQAHAAVLAERQRLAREMHDVLAHALAALALQLEGARLRAATHDDPELVEALERAHRLSRSGIEEAGRAIAMLRDEELPGPERLPALVAEFERDTGIPASIAIAGDHHGLEPDAQLTLFRVAQEALTNVRKHAQAARVELRLEWEGAGVRLSVEDFGEPGEDGDGVGYGLTGMRERAELLGGKLAAGPTSGGFRVDLWVPA